MGLLESNLVPDFLIRIGIRRLLAQRLREEFRGTPEEQQRHLMSFVQQLRASAVAIETAAANEQHYEVPSEFYRNVLGKHLKYSCCYYNPGVSSLDSAEAEMLALTVKRASIQNGERVLELGCGWGSLTLYMAEKFPASRITGVSNSHSQREHILAMAAARGLNNVEIITCDPTSCSFRRRRSSIVSCRSKCSNTCAITKRCCAVWRRG